MNNLFKLIALSALTITPTGLMAQNVEQIYMKSGSVVEGYIAEQNPGKYITIQSTKATIVVDSDTLRVRTTNKVPLDSLSAEWVQWAVDNSKYTEDDSCKYIELSTLEFRNSTYSNVYLLEKGSLIKFVDLSPNKYKFVWGDMYRTVKSRRPENLFSGLKEVLVLKNGANVSGQVIEQFPGEDLKIYTDNGDIMSYKFSQIKQIKTEKLTEGIDLWSQVRLLDKIRLKGRKKELIGFISSRTFGQDVVIEFMDGSKQTVNQNEIVSYAKIPNEKYVEVYDTILEDGEVLLNGKDAYFVTLETSGQYLLLGETASAQVAVGEQVCLEAKFADANIPITLVKAHNEEITIVKGKKKELVPWPVITYQDLVKSHVAISREVTPLGNVKVTFIVEEVGDYVLYIHGKNEYIVINVVE